MLSPPRREHALSSFDHGHKIQTLQALQRCGTCPRVNVLVLSRGQRFLASDRARHWLIDAIRFAREKHQFHLWAYVIMPEHAHLLIWPTKTDYDISKILASIKLPITRKALNYVRINAPRFLRRMRDVQPNGDIHHRFWQRGGGYDRNSIEPGTIWNQIEYIHNNPLRRGLCEIATDWRWSSAGAYAGLSEQLLLIDRESLPRTSSG